MKFIVLAAFILLSFICWDTYRDLLDRTKLMLDYKTMLGDCETELEIYRSAPILSIYEPENWMAIKVDIND